MSTDRHPHPRHGHDRGATLIEMLLTIALVGIILAAVSNAVIVLVRNTDDTTARVGAAQDVRQMTNYLPADIRSATADRVDVAGDGGQSIRSQCSYVPAGSDRQHLAVTTQTGLTRIEYRTVSTTDGARLDRWSCERTDTEAAFGPAQRVRIADALDATTPVGVRWVDERIEMTLVRSSGDVASLTASPFRPDAPIPTDIDVEVDDPVVATHCPANPNEYTEGFMVMTAGDVTFDNGANEAYGPIAVGGDLAFKNYRTSTQSGGTFFVEGDSQSTAVLVDGTVIWPDSGGGYLDINRGYLHVGDIANWAPASGGPSNELRLTATEGSQDRQIRVINTDQSFASVQRTGLFDFGAAFSAFRSIAGALEGLPGSCEGITDLELFGQNGVGEWTTGNVWLYYTPGKATVLSMTMAEYASIGNVNLMPGSAQPTRATPLIINITDVGPVTMPAGETNISRNHVPYVLWNFPHATQVTTSGAFWGAILAPDAVVVQNGDIRGNVISQELVANAGIISLQAFEGDFPWLSPVD